MNVEAKKFSHSSETIMFTVHHLPAEIIGHIFAYAADYPFLIEDMSAPPWNYSQVCSFWRTIALSLPTLWSRFIVCPSLTMPHQIDLLQLVLQRCAGRPLTFKYAILDPILEALFVELLLSSPQWHTVDISIPHQLAPQLAHIRHNLPLLHTMTLRTDILPSSDLHDWFLDAPMLCRLHLTGVHPIQDLLVPWSQLVEFSDGTNI